MNDEHGMGKRKLILASKSPRRLQLLSTIVPVGRIVVIEGDVDETIGLGETAEDYCRRIAKDKASAAVQKYTGPLENIAAVIGADTVVVFEGQIIGQPRDRDDAVRILKLLSGRQHDVVTGVALLCPVPQHADVLTVKSQVWMRDYDHGAVKDYVATGEPLDKAGAYAIQGKGKALIEKYEGSYSNIVGLPLQELKAALLRIPQ